MKKIFTTILTVISISLFAQNDSVSLGAGATDMVFYSLSTGTKTVAPNNDWHIAFSVRHVDPPFNTQRAVAIRINEAYGLQLYRCPNQKLAQFATLDTTGWETWQRMHNPDTTWTIGAFNDNTNFSDPYNYGWGEYTSAPLYNIDGDSSVYLIVMPDGTFRKFALINLVYDTVYNFQYSNLDNSGMQSPQIDKNLYPTKSFVYFNMLTAAILDKEPALTTWDMVFLRYNNTAYNSANLTQDMGVLTNAADKVFPALGANMQQPCYYGALSSDINIIGKTWFDQATDTVIPDLAYFVANQSGHQYRLVFTDFGQSATGEIGFNISECPFGAGITEVPVSISMVIYPVPASEQLDLTISSEQETSADIQLLDMSGRVLISQSSEVRVGENNLSMSLARIQSGNYIVAVSSQQGVVNRLVSVLK